MLLRGQTESGRAVNVLTGSDARLEPFSAFDDYIELRFTRRFMGKKGVASATALLEWGVKRWNAENDDQLIRAEVLLLKQIHRWPGEGKEDTFEVLKVVSH